MVKKFIGAMTLPIFFCLATHGQTYPVIGKPCPGFTLHNIEYFSKKTAELKDFRGKWLLLDFWAESCGACIAGFPDKNKIQKELGDRVQVMLVGIHGKEKLQKLYEAYQKKENLTMPCAYDTSLYYTRFDMPAALPGTILIDEKGIVRSITTTVNYDDMKQFLTGGNPELPKVHLNHEKFADDSSSIQYDREKIFAIQNNGAVDSEFLFRSIISNWKQGNPFSPAGSVEELAQNNSSFTVLGVSLADLYFYAYIGTLKAFVKGYSQDGIWYNRIIFESADTTLFLPDYNKGKNLFCYALNEPGHILTSDRVQSAMRKDLNLYFGFDVSVETRKEPCWKIICIDENIPEKLKTKGGINSYVGTMRLGFKATNFDFGGLIQGVNDIFPSEYFFDETGIKNRIDIDMTCEGCVLTDIMDFKTALQKNGLDLVRVEKEMKVLVIKDRKQ